MGRCNFFLAPLGKSKHFWIVVSPTPYHTRVYIYNTTLIYININIHIHALALAPQNPVAYHHSLINQWFHDHDKHCVFWIPSVVINHSNWTSAIDSRLSQLFKKPLGFFSCHLWTNPVDMFQGFATHGFFTAEAPKFSSFAAWPGMPDGKVESHLGSSYGWWENHGENHGKMMENGDFSPRNMVISWDFNGILMGF